MQVTIPREAFNPLFRPYLTDNTHRYLILYGGAGSGKSVFAVQRFLYRLLTLPLCNILVVRAVAATNRDSTTPWELVILNTSFAHTLLVTVGSSAATNPFCIFGVPAKALFLCDLVEDPSKLRQKVLVQTRELCASRPDLFFFPKTWEECEEILSRQLNELTPQVKEVAS